MIWALAMLCLIAICASAYAVWFCKGELAAQERMNEMILDKIDRLGRNDRSIHLILVNHRNHIDQIYDILSLDGDYYMHYDESYVKTEQ